MDTNFVTCRVVQNFHGKSSRLKIKQTVNTYQYNPTFYPQALCSCFRYSATSLKFHGISTIDLGAVKSGFAHPIVAVTFDGVPPEELGLRVVKSVNSLSCACAVSRPHAVRLAEYLPQCHGYTRRCSCANTLFVDSAGDNSILKLDTNDLERYGFIQHQHQQHHQVDTRGVVS